jgi:phosphoserine phosphatase RsbU/P
VAFALWDNVAEPLGLTSKIEPFGFAAFLAALGYVAARQTMERDQQLNAIQKELEVARRIQLSILPAEFPRSENFRVAARYIPMTSVAGDFYDFIVADDKQAGLLIADVSGHGVPAALIASMVKLAATSQRAQAADPSSFLAGMNSALLGNTQNQFVTAAYVHLDSEARELRYSAAGHPPMLLLRQGSVREIEENGLMLAAFDFAKYSNAAHGLEPGDRLLLYTDGILEATDAFGEILWEGLFVESLATDVWAHAVRGCRSHHRLGWAVGGVSRR